ncbi:MAG: TetR/AcrR family transcriptional regulator [Lachnospiraceae bacterium]|nr:TetR/AcrR family transcriptional regulator [Lachnospiraceae bacterium]
MGKSSVRERIVHACMELLNTVSLESLRTQDLIDRAGVSRSSFYRAFPDKYAVVTWVYQEQAERLLREMPELRSWKEWTYVLHAYMREHKAFFRNIAGYRGQNSFCDFLSHYFYGNALRFHKKPLTEEQKFALQAFSLVGANATVEWIMNGFQPDDELLVRYLDACIPSCIRSLYE